MITYAVEPWSQVWPELSALWDEHWREVAINQDVIRLDPDIEAYNATERAGMLHVVVAREAGRVVGYHISFVRPHFHYRHSLSAITDVYFIRATHRGPRTAIRFFEAVEATLRARGVQKVFTGTKLHIAPNGHALNQGRLLEHLDYVETERLYTKVIGD